VASRIAGVKVGGGRRPSAGVGGEFVSVHARASMDPGFACAAEAAPRIHAGGRRVGAVRDGAH